MRQHPINKVAQHVSRVGREGMRPSFDATFDAKPSFSETDNRCALQSNFQFILRLLNTNVDGKQKVVYALTKIKGVGRRYSNLVCKKADVDLDKRAGELTCTEYTEIPPKPSKGETARLLTTRTLQPKSLSVSSPLSRTLPSTRSPDVRSISRFQSDPSTVRKWHTGQFWADWWQFFRVP